MTLAGRRAGGQAGRQTGKPADSNSFPLVECRQKWLPRVAAVAVAVVSVGVTPLNWHWFSL